MNLRNTNMERCLRSGVYDGTYFAGRIEKL
jgi:hypothetical protein